MEDTMRDHWNSEELIGINCLIRNDESVVILNCYSVQEEESKQHYCFPLCETTTKSLERYDVDIWTKFQVFTEITYEEFTYVGGEGAMGNEGFIACLNSDRLPIWALFFENSNPFYKLEIVNNSLEAITSLDLKYQVDIELPERIKISYCQWIA